MKHGLQIQTIKMSIQQEDQQITYKYLFTITPLEIKSSSKIKSNSNKSILIKLGNKTAKCTVMNTPLELQVDVLYSKRLQKYCSIKGIIKIYDVSSDGSEIISCVGGFQTDELLNQGKSKVIIQKQIGTSKLKMDINIVNKSEKKNEEKGDHIFKQYISKQTSASREKYLLAKRNPSEKNLNIQSSQILSPKNSMLSSQVSNSSTQGRKIGNQFIGYEAYKPKPIEIPYQNTSKNINKSLEKINQALNFKGFGQSTISSKANEVLIKAELQTMKQQLNDQKKKSSLLQDRFKKANIQMLSWKSALTFYQNDTIKYHQMFKKLVNSLEYRNQNIITQLLEDKKTLEIRYKQKDIDKHLKDFMLYIGKKIIEPLPIVDLEIDYTEKDRTTTQFEQAKKEIAILKKLTTEKDKKIYSLQKQIEGIQVTNHNLKETNKHLNEENNYLRQKNDQIQLSIYHKQNSIETLRKQIDKYSYQIQQIQHKLYNAGLENQELKEEISNSTEIIEKYREKYGDLKNVKNRAIEMEIKECIRWIDQQNRDLEISQMQETMQSDQKDSRDDSLSSVIRNIQIQKVPIQQMSIIRNELLKILDKVNNLMTK